MVAMQNGRRASKQNGAPIASYFLVLLVVVFVLLFGFASTNEVLLTSSPPLVVLDNSAIQDALDLDAESRAMRIWRLQLQTACEQFLQGIPSGNNITQAHLERKAQVESEALGRMSVPVPGAIAEEKIPDKSSTKACEHVFIDLGTNRGDSIGCAVDASLDVCSAMFVSKDINLRPAYRLSLDFPRLHFDVNDLDIHGSGSQGLSLLRLLQDFFAKPGMESVCVYGMEGNPYFTTKLRQMEHVINSIQPSPLRHLHILTETIITSKDGPTSLYIDQYSEKNHVS